MNAGADPAEWVPSAPEGLSARPAPVITSFHSHEIPLWGVCGGLCASLWTFSREGDVGLNAESAFKPPSTHCTSPPAALCAVVFTPQRRLTSSASRGLGLLKRDFLNVSSRRESCFPLSIPFFVWVLWSGTWVWVRDGKPGATPLS